MRTLPQPSLPDSRTQPTQLADPLGGFNWNTLGSRYEDLCKKFEPSVPYLAAISPRPVSDRALYSVLVGRFAEELESTSGITYGTYLAMLYWKLYSQRAAIANTCEFLVNHVEEREAAIDGLKRLSGHLRRSAPAQVSEAISLIRDNSKFKIRGMKDRTALPVRTTFLHFVSPKVIPIFDKQVLLAVGVSERYANQKLEYLQLYFPHAVALVERHSQSFSSIDAESPLRLVDMALWVVLDRRDRKKRKCAS